MALACDFDNKVLRTTLLSDFLLPHLIVSALRDSLGWQLLRECKMRTVRIMQTSS